jgi:hypothetical protein
VTDVEDAVPALRACPTCGRFDRVANVAAVREHTAGTPFVAPPAAPTGRAAGAPEPVLMWERAMPRLTRLDRALSPAPRSSVRAWAIPGVLVGALAAGTFYLYHGAVHVGLPFPLDIPLFFTGFSAALLLLASTVHLRLGPVRRGREKAEEISRLGWYCGRCGTVYFQQHQAPEGAQHSKPYSLAEFRRFVFRAGGYEHLVDVRSVR